MLDIYFILLQYFPNLPEPFYEKLSLCGVFQVPFVLMSIAIWSWATVPFGGGSIVPFSNLLYITSVLGDKQKTLAFLDSGQKLLAS
jgi:hypothetical protein